MGTHSSHLYIKKFTFFGLKLRISRDTNLEHCPTRIFVTGSRKITPLEWTGTVLSSPFPGPWKVRLSDHKTKKVAH